MFAVRDVNTRKLLKPHVYKMPSPRIEVYDTPTAKQIKILS